MLGPDDSGQEAYDVVLAHMRTVAPKSVPIEQCEGFTRWRNFLLNNKRATLEQCLVEFESTMRRKPVVGWPVILLEALKGRIYPEFVDRVIAAGSADCAASIAAKAERLGLDRNQVKAATEKCDSAVRVGVKAPARRAR